jgi:hypothetical protein
MQQKQCLGSEPTPMPNPFLAQKQLQPSLASKSKGPSMKIDKTASVQQGDDSMEEDPDSGSQPQDHEACPQQNERTGLNLDPVAQAEQMV